METPVTKSYTTTNITGTCRNIEIRCCSTWQKARKHETKGGFLTCRYCLRDIYETDCDKYAGAKDVQIIDVEPGQIWLSQHKQKSSDRRIVEILEVSESRGKIKIKDLIQEKRPSWILIDNLIEPSTLIAAREFRENVIPKRESMRKSRDHSDRLKVVYPKHK